MRRVALVIALMLLTGCGGTPTKVETPSPAPTPTAAAVDLCDLKVPLAERQKALPLAVVTMLNQGKEVPTCLRVDRLPGDNTAFVTTIAWEAGPMAALAWRLPGSAWTAANIQAPAGGWQVADHLMVFGPVRLPDGVPEFFMLGTSSGTGGFQVLFHVTGDSKGALAAAAVTDVYEKAWFRFLEPDLIFLNYRGNPGPQAWECNACMTANNQILWSWDGKQLKKVGERQWSEPYLTVNLMLGALKSGDSKTAARYVTDPALVEQAAKLIGPDVMSWQANFWSEAYDQIQNAERTNWDLLPPNIHTTVPVTGYDITLTKDSQKVVLHTTRTDKGWLVSGIN